MSETSVQFCRELVRRFPWILPCLSEHLSDNEGAILPHVFLSDICRNLPRHASEAPHLLRYLNSLLRGENSEIENLIAVGFVESIDHFGEIEDLAEWGDYFRIKEEWLRQGNAEN